MVWVIFALLTGVAVFAVLWPLSRAPLATNSRELDVSFYKAQTAEIERDAARGVIGQHEADVARNEAGRRLVAASQRDVRDVRHSSRFATVAVALGALVFVPALALTIYLRIGAPNLPDDPLEARLNADPQTMDMATIIAKIERAVAKNPNDGRGWSLREKRSSAAALVVTRTRLPPTAMRSGSLVLARSAWRDLAKPKRL